MNTRWPPLNVQSRLEGIIPAIETAHAIAYLETLMPLTTKDDIVVLELLRPRR